jgi:hypothetical protein
MKKWLVIAIWAAAAGCGVRGDPVPPGTPVEIGRGKPSYKRATEELAFPVVEPPNSNYDNEKEGESDR